MRSVLQEMRHALSHLRHSPGFTVLAIAILGLGLGVTLYMFTFVKAYMLTPLPYPHAERIMHVERTDPLHGFDGMEVTQHDFVEWRQVQESFSALAAFHAHPVILADSNLPNRFDGAYITPSAFDVTAVEAFIGRTLVPEDAKPGAPDVIVLGYDVWQNRYGGDPAILGETIRVNGVPTTVVGVMPPGFRFPVNQNVWLPMEIDLTQFDRGDGFTVQVFGRLKPNVTLGQARAEFATVAAALAERYEQNENITAAIKPFQHEFVSSESRTVVSAMFVSVLFVLIIACSNVANLMLARTVARRKDIAVRSALGASRWRLLAHVLTETLALAAAGAVIACFLADFGLDMTNKALVAADKPRPFWIDLSIDWKVLTFGACAAIASGLVAGLVPSVRATRMDVNEYLKEGAKGSGSASRLSRSLVTAQIAFSCILLVCSGLMIRSVVNLNAQPLGIDAANLLTGRIGLPGTQFPDVASRLRFFDRLVERLEAHPEVRGATAAWSYPGIDGWLRSYRTRDMEVPESGQLPWTNYAGVMNNYADMLGIELLRGRWFDSRDLADSEPVAVIDQGFAREIFPDVDPIGQQIMIGAPDDGSARWRTIIGVTEELLLDQLDDPHHPATFVPLAQAPSGLLTVAVRTRGEPLAFSQALHEAVFAIDRNIPVYAVRTLDNWIWAGSFTAQLVSVLFSAFGVLALILAAAGIYGVLAYSVSQRTREIGVRRALGAIDGSILGMVLGQAGWQLGIGLGLGLVCAVGFARLLSSMLRGVSAFDPLTLVAAAMTLSIVALVASLLPAMRALKVHPMEALRYE
jgi:putative ABC transport system permease protein